MISKPVRQLLYLTPNKVRRNIRAARASKARFPIDLPDSGYIVQRKHESKVGLQHQPFGARVPVRVRILAPRLDLAGLADSNSGLMEQLSQPGTDRDVGSLDFQGSSLEAASQSHFGRFVHSLSIVGLGQGQNVTTSHRSPFHLGQARKRLADPQEEEVTEDNVEHMRPEGQCESIRASRLRARRVGATLSQCSQVNVNPERSVSLPDSSALRRRDNCWQLPDDRTRAAADLEDAPGFGYPRSLKKVGAQLTSPRSLLNVSLVPIHLPASEEKSICDQRPPANRAPAQHGPGQGSVRRLDF